MPNLILLPVIVILGNPLCYGPTYVRHVVGQPKKPPVKAKNQEQGKADPQDAESIAGKKKKVGRQENGVKP